MHAGMREAARAVEANVLGGHVRAVWVSGRSGSWEARVAAAGEGTGSEAKSLVSPRAARYMAWQSVRVMRAESIHCKASCCDR